ncbi:MAG: hypothetical protein IPP47_07425 [Bryobacterales bacterium]|nr:hypothetical protein [Bryobacterales bacterium]
MNRAIFVLWVVASAAWGQSVAALGPPRWMAAGAMPEARSNPVAASHDKALRAILERIRVLPVLNPPPGVYPKASLSFLPPEVSSQPPGSVLMVGFWPPKDVRISGSGLRPAGELSHLLFYLNRVREDAFDRTHWSDSRGSFYPVPPKLADVQGFPVYQGYGSAEVSGILVILPPGKELFAPITQERFHLFAIARLEKQIATAAPALKRARELYDAAITPAGRAALETRIASSLESYTKNRPRTPEQIRYRETELRRLEAQEEERLKLEASPDTNRLIGPLQQDLVKARQAFAALTAGQKPLPACHLVHPRDSGIPQPVLPETPACIPIVAVAPFIDGARPGASRLISVERYWTSLQTVRRGLDRSERYIYHHLNVETVEALDWKAVAAGLAPGPAQ